MDIDVYDGQLRHGRGLPVFYSQARVAPSCGAIRQSDRQADADHINKCLTKVWFVMAMECVLVRGGDSGGRADPKAKLGNIWHAF
jgi:hypothetical protein